jgi:hypothetical protein
MHNTATQSATYSVIDTHSGKVIATYDQAKPARTRRDRLDSAYGAARYVVRIG